MSIKFCGFIFESKCFIIYRNIKYKKNGRNFFCFCFFVFKEKIGQ